MRGLPHGSRSPSALGALLALAILSSIVGCGGASATTTTTTAASADEAPIPPEALAAFQSGVRELEREDRAGRERARAYFEEALSLAPGLWEARYDLAYLAREEGNLVGAREELERARELAPHSGEVLVALAEVRSLLGEPGEAASLLRAYVQGHPDEAGARVALATLLREARDYDGALEHAREALIRDPRNVRALAEVGRVYRAREEYDVAELVFQKALELGESAELHDDLGLLELARGDTQAAFEAFARAIALDPTFKDAHANQGSVLLHAGDYAGAAAEYRAVLEQDADDVDARIALGICLRGQGDTAGAEREYRAAIERAPRHPGALYDYAILRAEFLDQRQQSLELFRRFLEVAPRGLEARATAERYIQDITAEANRPPPPPPSAASDDAGDDEPMDL